MELSGVEWSGVKSSQVMSSQVKSSGVAVELNEVEWSGVYDEIKPWRPLPKAAPGGPWNYSYRG